MVTSAAHLYHIKTKIFSDQNKATIEYIHLNCPLMGASDAINMRTNMDCYVWMAYFITATQTKNNVSDLSQQLHKIDHKLEKSIGSGTNTYGREQKDKHKNI